MPPEERDGLKEAETTVRALRGEHGCPWDKAQTHGSLRKYLLEESYETLEALDRLADHVGAAVDLDRIWEIARAR